MYYQKIPNNHKMKLKRCNKSVTPKTVVLFGTKKEKGAVKNSPFSFFSFCKMRIVIQLKKEILSRINEEREEFKKKWQEHTLEDTREFLENYNETKKEIQEREIAKETRKRNNDKPSTQRAVRKGYIRQTFVISKENLEIIRALTSFLNTTQVDLLEALINKGLEVFSDKDKEQALNLYRNSNNEEKASTLNKYFN